MESRSSVVRHLFSVLRAELALRLRQGLRLDQPALSLVAAPALAEANDHGVSGAFPLYPARKQPISGGEGLENVESDATPARAARGLPSGKITRASAPRGPSD